MNFAPSCGSRGSHAEIGIPNWLVLEKLVRTPLNCVWLNVLNDSKRSSKWLPRASLSSPHLDHRKLPYLETSFCTISNALATC